MSEPGPALDVSDKARPKFQIPKYCRSGIQARNSSESLSATPRGESSSGSRNRNRTLPAKFSSRSPTLPDSLEPPAATRCFGRSLSCPRAARSLSHSNLRLFAFAGLEGTSTRSSTRSRAPYPESQATCVNENERSHDAQVPPAGLCEPAVHAVRNMRHDSAALQQFESCDGRSPLSELLLTASQSPMFVFP